LCATQWRVTLLIFVLWGTGLSALYSTLNMNVGKAAKWLSSYKIFLETTFLSLFGSLALAVALVGYYAWTGLLFRYGGAPEQQPAAVTATHRSA